MTEEQLSIVIEDINKLAIQLADLLDKDMKAGPDQESIMTEVFAPKKRKPVWKELHIYPSGVDHEVQNSIASCLTNVDGDYVSLAKKALRLGLSTIYTSNLTPFELGDRLGSRIESRVRSAEQIKLVGSDRRTI